MSSLAEWHTVLQPGPGKKSCPSGLKIIRIDNQNNNPSELDKKRRASVHLWFWACLLSPLKYHPFYTHTHTPGTPTIVSLHNCRELSFVTKVSRNVNLTSRSACPCPPAPPRDALLPEIALCVGASNQAPFHAFDMYDNVPFLCQVNIFKSYTHTNEIII